MEFNELNSRVCIRAYYWHTRAKVGTFTAELVNTKGIVLVSILSCPDAFGPGQFKILIGNKTSREFMTLENAVLVAESLVNVSHVDLIVNRGKFDDSLHRNALSTL